MSLSRLPPRTNQKGLKLRSSTKKQGHIRAQMTVSRHSRLWEAIRVTRKELEQWRSLSAYIHTLFRDRILPRERLVTNMLCALNSSLLDHFNNPKNSTAERSLLGLWIVQNFNTLAYHPFTTESEYGDLLTRFSKILDENDPIERQLIRLVQPLRTTESDAGALLNAKQRNAASATFCQQDTTDSEEEYEEPAFDFGWHKKASSTYERHNKNAQDSTNAAINASDEIEDDTGSIHSVLLEEKIRKSQKNLSVDRLFRQLAKVLHPDREPDETTKTEKHLLMSQCLVARRQNDIDKLLQLYCEHVGDLPEDLTDTSHQEFIAALELQLKIVQRELHQQRFGDALLTRIVDRYSDSNNDKIEANVAVHARKLDQEIKQHETTIENLKTHSGLQTALNQRRSIELDRMTINDITGTY